MAAPRGPGLVLVHGQWLLQATSAWHLGEARGCKPQARVAGQGPT